MIVVSDTSSIRGLISVGKTHLLKLLFGKIAIPDAVKNKLFRIKAVKIDIKGFLTKDWVEIREIKGEDSLQELGKHLDRGESEAIVLAKELNASFILMDEHKGRKIAKSLGIDVMGLIGILILAKEKQLLPQVKPLLDTLREDYGFWIDEAFYTKILKSIHEA